MGALFIFAMTVLGAALVFFFRGEIHVRIQRICFGFAAGVMCAAAVFSLLLPALQEGSLGSVCLSFAAGAGLLLLMDAVFDRLPQMKAAQSSDRRGVLLFAAMTLHNIPEGMAVGLAFAQAADGSLAPAAAAALAAGIGLQNLPEGAAISLPMRQNGESRARSFLAGVLSGAAEPVFALAAVSAAAAAQPAMPALMAFSAGAMMLVVFSHMLPQAAAERDGALCAMMGFVLMMAMDVGLG